MQLAKGLPGHDVGESHLDDGMGGIYEGNAIRAPLRALLLHICYANDQTLTKSGRGLRDGF